VSHECPDPRLVAAADIVYALTVRADSMRFTTAPESSVTFDGEPGVDSGSGSRRINVPDEVTEGKVYRTVRIDYVIAARVITTGPGERSSDAASG